MHYIDRKGSFNNYVDSRPNGQSNVYADRVNDHFLFTSFFNKGWVTLTDLDSSCPRSLLKTTPTPPGYPWVSGGRYVTPEPRFSGLVLGHQGLEELEPKIHPKTAVFDRFLASGCFQTWWSSTKPLKLGSGVIPGPSGTHGHPGGVGVVFSKDLGQLELRSVSVYSWTQCFSSYIPSFL